MTRHLGPTSWKWTKRGGKKWPIKNHKLASQGKGSKCSNGRILHLISQIGWWKCVHMGVPLLFCFIRTSVLHVFALEKGRGALLKATGDATPPTPTRVGDDKQTNKQKAVTLQVHWVLSACLTLTDSVVGRIPRLRGRQPLFHTLLSSLAIVQADTHLSVR